jgi:hypothetical protein
MKPTIKAEARYENGKESGYLKELSSHCFRFIELSDPFINEVEIVDVSRIGSGEYFLHLCKGRFVFV